MGRTSKTSSAAGSQTIVLLPIILSALYYWPLTYIYIASETLPYNPIQNAHFNYKPRLMMPSYDSNTSADGTGNVVSKLRRSLRCAACVFYSYSNADYEYPSSQVFRSVAYTRLMYGNLRARTSGDRLLLQVSLVLFSRRSR